MCREAGSLLQLSRLDSPGFGLLNRAPVPRLRENKYYQKFQNTVVAHLPLTCSWKETKLSGPHSTLKILMSIQNNGRSLNWCSSARVHKPGGVQIVPRDDLSCMAGIRARRVFLRDLKDKILLHRDDCSRGLDIGV